MNILLIRVADRYQLSVGRCPGQRRFATRKNGDRGRTWESLPDVDLDKPLTLADAIRAGSTVTEHSTQGWGAGERVCALSAAAIAAAAWGYA